MLTIFLLALHPPDLKTYLLTPLYLLYYFSPQKHRLDFCKNCNNFWGTYQTFTKPSGDLMRQNRSKDIRKSELCWNFSFVLCDLKFSFSEKATKIWKNLPLLLMLLSKNSLNFTENSEDILNPIDYTKIVLGLPIIGSIHIRL